MPNTLPILNSCCQAESAEPKIECLMCFLGQFSFVQSADIAYIKVTFTDDYWNYKVKIVTDDFKMTISIVAISTNFRVWPLLNNNLDISRLSRYELESHFSKCQD